ncbi:hypothetical protein MHZ95_18390 [Sporosarcina sp. ACRSM]|uniref:hypothetical protein n=1 Tax=Sporosarcina sp. ACRSM TaxID=2918216 RepID=UPI001EF5E083|nr:hypothetical protein [Sporosarcina sp. ACRSM]MCG7337229.1 hypothetical protein [Sporosarcina sp. ACRSM]
MNKDMLLSLVDRVIKVDRGGPESRYGKLLAAEEDHFILLTEDDGIIYYNTHHVKSLTVNAKNEVKLNFDIPRGLDYVKAENFRGVVEKLRYRWVKINRGGPETLEGVMDVVNDDFITIVSNEEIINLSMFHVRNISYGVKVEKANKGKGNESNKQTNAKKENE